MVVLGSVYRFCAEEVAAIGAKHNANGEYPFTLTVYLKNGKELSVVYKDEKAGNAAVIDLSRQIDREKRQDNEKIHNALFILRGTVDRIDKRQLRIWKQLKALLGVKGELEC